MKSPLTVTEVRVLGSLLEKDLVTPEGYPLSLAALTAACNQKSSREPVMTLDEATVLDAVNALIGKHLVRERSGAGSRVSKYEHRLSGTLDPARDFSQAQRAVLALLMLRGPQTVGELRTRSGRMYEFRSLEEVERVLHELAERPGAAYVAELPRLPGQRERRFMQLLGGDEIPTLFTATGGSDAAAEISERVAALEEEVVLLRQTCAELRAKLDELANH